MPSTQPPPDRNRITRVYLNRITRVYLLKEDRRAIFKLDFVKKLLEVQGIWLAGGALRTLIDKKDEPLDFDFFFENELKVALAKDLLKALGFVIETDYSTVSTWNREGTKVQLITREFYHDPTALVDSFDFTICCCATDMEYIYWKLEFAKDVFAKKLVFNRVNYPVSTIMRIQKYRSRGYLLSGFEVARLVGFITSGEYKVAGFYDEATLELAKAEEQAKEDAKKLKEQQVKDQGLKLNSSDAEFDDAYDDAMKQKDKWNDIAIMSYERQRNKDYWKQSKSGDGPNQRRSK